MSFYSIKPFSLFRQTPNVEFYNVPLLTDLKAIDLVLHAPGAISPGSIKNVKRPWYYHPHQIDNLTVFHGHRIVNLYYLGEKEILTFEVTPHTITQLFYHDDGSLLDKKLLSKEPAYLTWETKTFHRIESGSEGSSSMNFALRTSGFDIKTNFNIYDLDIKNQTFTLLREGHKDQH